MSKRLHMLPLSQSVVAKDRMVLASPRKVNLVAKMIRGMKVMKALDALQFCEKAVARDVRKVLEAAIANAENNHGLDLDSLFVQEAYVGKAIVLRRFMARAKGSGASIHKKFSHLTIVVCEASEVA